MIKFEMKEQEVDLTLDFYHLAQLETKHPKDYKRYNEACKAGVQNDLDAVKVIYTAYLCANMDQMPDVMSYEEFLQKMKNGRDRVWKAYTALYTDVKN